MTGLRALFLSATITFFSALTIVFSDINYNLGSIQVLDDDDPNISANTGITCDTANNILYISGWHNTGTNYILELDLADSSITQHELPAEIVSIQGIDYYNDSLWVYAVHTAIIYKLNPDYSVAQRITMEDLTADLDQAMFDLYNDTIYLASPSHLTGIYRYDTTGTKLDTILIYGYDIFWEGIEVADGFIWMANLDSLFRCDLTTGEILEQYARQTYTSTNVEDLTFNYNDSSIWISVDENYHEEITGGNRVWHYDVYNQTDDTLKYDSDIPQAYCKLSSNSYITPVHDFMDYDKYKDTANYYHADTVTIQFRGSDTRPIGDSTTGLGVTIFDANNPNLGWSQVSPTDWLDTVPDLRYIQIKITEQ